MIYLFWIAAGLAALSLAWGSGVLCGMGWLAVQLGRAAAKSHGTDSELLAMTQVETALVGQSPEAAARILGPAYDRHVVQPITKRALEERDRERLLAFIPMSRQAS